MIPYTNFYYFGFALYAILPVFLFGGFKLTSRFWLVIATGFMLILQYAVTNNIIKDMAFWELWIVLGYAAAQYSLAAIFLFIRKRGSNRIVFWIVIMLCLTPLLAGKVMPLVQPAYALVFLGLSYATFRCLDVIIGIQDGLIKTLPPFQYLTFLLFFPTISSGPVDRYQRFSEDWNHQRTRNEIITDVDGAIHRIFRGFLYKFILASLINTYWLEIAAGQHGLWANISYMYAYSFYLFFDFAGYSAFAIGFSYIFGIHSPENFNLPFLSTNIRDFWNRWHISLSSFFRDHIYNRFVFAALKGRWFKNKYTASYLGFLLSMGLMGLWHGTAWNYLIYGLYHGVLLILTDWIERNNKKKKWWDENKPMVKVLSIFITFQLVCFGLLIFSGHLG